MGKNTINIREIAKRAGCSASTVSRVLAGRTGSVKISEKTSVKVREICKELDYQPSIHAARLFSGQSGVIGFLSSSPLLPEDINYAKSFFYLCAELYKSGYRLLPFFRTSAFLEEKEYLNIFKRNEIDGMIVWGAREDDMPLREIHAAGHPVLSLTNKVGDFPSVYSEQRKPFAELARACILNGAKRVAGIMCEVGFSLQQRKAGFEDAVNAHSCESRIWNFRQFPESTLKAASQIAPKILEWKPDAIVCCNDETAVGIIRFCLDKGIRIPEQIMISGGDNIKLSEYSQIPLTTFDQMAPECAKIAAKIMLANLRKGKPLHSEVIESKVIWRASLPEPNR